MNTRFIIANRKGFFDTKFGYGCFGPSYSY